MSDIENAVDGADDARLPDEPKQETEVTQESSPAKDETTEEAPKPKKHDGGFQRRINQLTWEKRELERRLAEREQAKPEAADPSADPVTYVRQLAQEEARRLLEETRRAETEQQKRQQFEQVQATFQQKSEDFASEHPDYWDAVQALDSTVPMGPELVEVIGTSDLGPQLTYYLAQHMDEAVQIAGLPAHLAAARIARIESKLSAVPQVKPTNTPTPPPRLAGSAVVSKDPQKMTYAEYKAMRMKES